MKALNKYRAFQAILIANGFTPSETRIKIIEQIKFLRSSIKA